MHTKLGSIASNAIDPLSPTDTISYALEYMRSNAISSVTVTDSQNRPIGIFTEFDAVKSLAKSSDKSSTLETIMSKNVFYVQEDVYTHDGYILMEEKGFRHLIIVDENKKYLGIVSEGDFLRHMGFDAISSERRVFEYMSESILTVDENEKITTVAQLMSERKCEYTIVLRNSVPVSIINERDIAVFYTEDDAYNEKRITDIKEHGFYSVSQGTPIQDASTKMKEHSVHQLLVIDEEENFIGLITRHDILKAIHGSYFELLIKTIEEKSAREETLKRHQKELEKLVNYDHLTELPNRLLFSTLLNKSASRAIRNNHVSAVVLIDLDRFQDINDSYGHTIGDELLLHIATRLNHRARMGDVIARLGGDEFAIIFEQLANKNDAATVTQALLSSLRESFELSNGIKINIDASAGIVLIPEDSDNAEEILQYADSALNKAKKSGRSTYKFYTTEMTQHSKEKLEYEVKLKKAIKNGEFEMYYQPQVHIKTGRIISAEALIRWNEPNEGLIPPNCFIPIAEESVLINEIGNFVINTVCKQGKIWQDKGYHISLALNLSPNQLKYQDILSVIEEALKSTHFTPQKLEIEITEGAIMHNVQGGLELLHAIKAKGIRIAIDDFGTGYSSLSYLKQFPIDVLKIDKSFIENVPYNKDDTAITRAIIDMSKALGYQVLAEGVENIDQLNFLKDYKCDIYQGYYKSKPIKALEFEKMLKAQFNLVDI